MFNFKNEAHKFFVSPQSGRAVSIMEIPDEVFSEKILGDGVGIIPEEDIIVSPVDGKIVQIADTKHAFCITSDDGLDIMIHVGVDTVGLKGEGFECNVSVDQHVKAGEKIGSADINLIKEKRYPLHTAVLVTNMASVGQFNPIYGSVEAGVTKIIEYTKK